MRLSDKHRQIISDMEKDGYIWLSHLPINAQMRFRNKTRAGFTGYLKVEGLTFLTECVAEMIKCGSKNNKEPRLTYKEQITLLEKRLVELEAENYRLKGVGERHEKLKAEAYEN